MHYHPVFHNEAVPEPDNSSGFLTYFLFVGHKYNCMALPVQGMEDGHYFFACFTVKIPCGFVGKYYCGVIDQSPGNGYSLFLATRISLGR